MGQNDFIADADETAKHGHIDCPRDKKARSSGTEGATGEWRES
jgi:hypothetical protein